MLDTKRTQISLQNVAPHIADRGTVRLGSGCITAMFPPRS